MLKASGRSDEQTGTQILLEAMSKDKVHLARFVLDALDGGIVDSVTEGAQTPLISSVLLPDGRTRCKFVELLLQRGASVNCQDGQGRTALSHACERGHLDAVKTLVRSNADPEVVDCWGNTALMYAAGAGHFPVVEFLVRAFKRLGLQIDRQNKVGNSAVEVAKLLGHTECISALTNGSKKGRESEGAQGNAQPRPCLRCDAANDKFESKVEHVVNKLEVLQTCSCADCVLAHGCSWQQRPRTKLSTLPPMDSIEELDRENGGSPPPPRELDSSGPLTPKTPSHHSPNFKHPKPGERLSTADDHLPSLLQSCEAHGAAFLSPRSSRNASKPSATSTLGILLTPILTNKSESESAAENLKVLDSGVHRFHDSYYQKRCSLPSSLLSPAPPERTLVPVRKPRTVRREATPCKAEAPHFTTPAAAASTTTFSVLSNKLLRRFTSPEFKKDTKDLDPGFKDSVWIPRSETFPQSITHPQVDSKPSIDSISSVKCEFDFQLRAPNS